MSKPFTRAQRLENDAFLRALRLSGNAAEAARTLGFGRSRFLNRRAADPAFAARWAAAMVLAQATLRRAQRHDADRPYRPGEPCVRRASDGRLQLRRYRPGMVDHAGRQRFLAALSASANVRLSAAAAGFSAATLYRERERNPAFAREWLLALQTGYDRLELALLEGALPEAFTEDDWRRNDPPAIPRMSADQALQLLYLHQKEARLNGTPRELDPRRRPRESEAARHERLSLMSEQRLEREREKFRIAEAERLVRGEPTHQRWAPGALPDLSQVTGWSEAKEGVPTDRGRALFGGWRIDDWRKRE